MNKLFEKAKLQVVFDNPWEAPGKWFKGVIHMHTTESDGAKTPQQAIDYYRERGYDFACITDHGIVTKVLEKPDDDFLCMSGVETLLGYTARGYSFCCLGIGMQEWLYGRLFGKSPSETKKIMKQQGALIAFDDVGFSYFGPEDDHLFDGCFAVEIYSHAHHIKNAEKDWCHVWDGLLERGHVIYGIADDDAHEYDTRRADNCPSDACGGWNMVKAESLDKKSILKALSKGSFYASTGPVIEYMGFTDDSFVIKCSDAAYVDLKCTFGGFRNWAPKGKFITHTEFPLKKIIEWHRSFFIDGWNKDQWVEDRNDFLRVEVTDASGRRAWSNPFWLKRK